MKRYVNLADEPAQIDPWEEGVVLCCRPCGEDVRVHVFPADHLRDLFPYECGACIEKRLAA